MISGDCSQLRVLLVGGYPPPFGGIATHLASLVPGLKARGAEDIAVITFSDKDACEHIDGATIYRHTIKKHLFQLANPRNWLLIARVVRELSPVKPGFRTLVSESLKAIFINRIAKKHNSQVVNFYESDAHFEMVPLARYWKGKRGVSLTVFGEMYSSPELMQARKALVKKSLELPLEVWASSDHCGSSFKSLGIYREVKTVYLGVDLDAEGANELRDEFRRNNDIAKDDVVVLFMGRFVKDMGFDVVLDVIPELLEQVKTVRFVLAGAKGDLSSKAELLASRYPKQVFLFQNFPFSLQKTLYSNADILVAPSFCQRACMGLSIKEAMAASLPVVATLSGGIPEAVIHEETGFLVPLNIKTRSADVPEFKKYLVQLIDDKSLRERFGQAGRQRAEVIFSVDTTLNRIADIFMSVRKKMACDA